MNGYLPSFKIIIKKVKHAESFNKTFSYSAVEFLYYTAHVKQ